MMKKKINDYIKAMEKLKEINKTFDMGKIRNKHAIEYIEAQEDVIESLLNLGKELIDLKFPDKKR